MLTVTGFAGVSQGKGYIVGQNMIALDVIIPEDKASFKVGTKTTEAITITVGRK